MGESEDRTFQTEGKAEINVGRWERAQNAQRNGREALYLEQSELLKV